MNELLKRVTLFGIVGVTCLVVFAGAVGRDGGLFGSAAANGSSSRVVAPPAPAASGAPSAAPRPDRAQQLRQRLREDPTDTTARLELADLAFQARRYAEAADLLVQAVEANPNDSKLRVGLGLAFFYHGIPTLAHRELRRAIELDPDNVDAHYNYAMVVSHGPQADPDAAKAAWEAVARLDGDGELGRQAREFLAQPRAGKK